MERGNDMINRVVLVGNLTRDPQYFKTQSGISYARFTVATTKKYGNNEETAFISCIAWRGAADYLNQYAKRGSMVAVEGHITTGSYDDKTTGKKVYTTDVTADNVRLINGPKEPHDSTQQPSSQSKSNSSYSQSSYQDNNDISDDDFNTGPLLDISSDDLPF